VVCSVDNEVGMTFLEINGDEEPTKNKHKPKMYISQIIDCTL